MKTVLRCGLLAAGTLLSTAASATVLYNTPPAATGLSGYTSTITINADGSYSTVGGGPNFGSEDSLVHVVNLSSQSVAGLALSGTNIFGFDADGTLGGADPLDYSGSLTTFSITSLDAGTVNFTGGLAANSDSYFELEEDVGAAGSGFAAGPTTGPGTSPGSNAVPEPASLALLGVATAGVGLLRRKRS